MYFHEFSSIIVFMSTGEMVEHADVHTRIATT